MKIRQIERNALLPKLLPDADVPAKNFFRLQIRVVTEDDVLTARRAEPCRDTRVERRICLVDLIAAGDTISPDAAERVEVSELAAGDKDQVFNWRQRRLRNAGDLLCVVAYKSRLWSERLRNEWALLPGIDPAVVKARGERKPRGWMQIVLIINLGPFE